jgi:hypothetical protein
VKDGAIGNPSKNVPSTTAETVTLVEQGQGLAHTVRGRETKRVTREELTKLLSPDDLKFVTTYEKRLSQLYDQWVDVSEQIETTGGVEHARLKGQIVDIAKKMADCLKQILDFLPKIGFALDDHYQALRQIVG